MESPKTPVGSDGAWGVPIICASLREPVTRYAAFHSRTKVFACMVLKRAQRITRCRLGVDSMAFSMATSITMIHLR